MAPPGNNRFFFIHVMKTGGMSFSDLIHANFQRTERYPDVRLSPDADIFERMEAYMRVPDIVAQVNARADQLHIVSAHVPYAVRFLFNKPYVAITMLRDPVDRIVSYLKHCRKYHVEHMGMELERIYEDSWFQASFIQNYQTKIFAMTPQESVVEERVKDRWPLVPPREQLGNGLEISDEILALRDQAPGRFLLETIAACTGVIELDDSRLQSAKNNLDEVEVVGVTTEYEKFVNVLSERYNWKIGSVPHKHAGDSEEIPADFRRRIAQDNLYDQELYEYAKALGS